MYNCVIVGAGNKGAFSDIPGSKNEHKYLSYAHAIKEHPGFNLLGFVDTDEKKGRLAAVTWDCCYFGNDIKDVNQKIDIIIIATSDDSHVQPLYEASCLKPKMVICEKPICSDINEAKWITLKYKNDGIPLMVDYTRRFIPKYREFYNKLSEKGKFIKGYLYYNGGLLHTASHFVDLALWYGCDMDKIEIVEVDASYKWVFQWGLFFENDFISEQAVNLKNANVDTIYDNHMWYVMDHVWDRLRNNVNLYCSGDDALKALEYTLRFVGNDMKNNNLFDELHELPNKKIGDE